jgi:hypothetical protein
MRFLTRKGFLIEEQGMSYLADTDPDRGLGSLQAAACTYRIALGPRAGHKVLTLQTVPTREPPAPVRCVNEQGFSLHAEVCCAAHQMKKLEHLCRYITRPAIANERLTLNRAGDVVLQLKSPYQDGTTHIVMSPLEFMPRLAALIPRPRLHLIRFHGVLAPEARPREGPAWRAEDAAPDCVPRSFHPRGANPRFHGEATLRPLVAKQAPSPVPGFPTVPVNAHTPSADPAEALPPAAPTRLSWARLLKRVFEIDLEHCPHCGGPLMIIAAPSTGSGQASNISPSLRRSSPTSACPPGPRPDRLRGHSIDSQWDPSHPVPLAEPTASFGRHSPERPKRPWTRAPRTAEGPRTSRILDRRIVSLTTHRSIGTLPLVEKGPLKFLYPSSAPAGNVAAKKHYDGIDGRVVRLPRHRPFLWWRARRACAATSPPRIRAPRTDESPKKSTILNPRIVSLTTLRSIGTLPLAEKAFEIPYTCATGMCPIILRTQMFEGWSKAKTALFAFRRRKALDVLFQRSVRD